MKSVITRIWNISFTLILLLFLSSCQRALSQPPLQVPVLEFSGAESGFPPKLKEQVNVTEVPWKEIPGSLTDALASQIRQAALQDGRVLNLLGDRFAYITTDVLESPKYRRRLFSEPIATRVTLFSHTNNVAVEAQMQGLAVERVQIREGYQPPEGRDEIDLAVQLARRDRRLSDTVRDLKGEAILASLKPEKPSYGDRVLYVAFSNEADYKTLYFALVDLTKQTVLDAGAVESQSQTLPR